MFCHITENWRGRPLVSHEVIVNLIGSTRTRTGLRIQAELDTTSYATGIKVTNKELEAVRLKKDKFHGEWNYTILPTGSDASICKSYFGTAPKGRQAIYETKSGL